MGKILTPRDGFKKPPLEVRVERLETVISMLLGVQAVGYRAFAQAFGGSQPNEKPAAPGAEAADEQRGEDQTGGLVEETT